MRRVMRVRSPARLLVVVVGVLAISAASCSGGETSDASDETGFAFSGDVDSSPATTVAWATTTTAAGEAGFGEAPAPEDADRDLLGTGGISPVVFESSELGREMIFTADLTVAVTDVAGVGEEATRLIQSLGGFLFGQRTVGSPQPSSVLTFKVDPADFSEALNRLGSLGELRSQDVSADDVTDRIVDLESRINTAAASVERLRVLLGQAADIKAVVDLENELLERETLLETLRSRLRTVQDQVSLATITLTLTEAVSRPALELNVTAYPGHDDGLSCPGSGGLGVSQGTETTVCFEIINVGDTWLTGFELRDPVLDVEIGDLMVVFGDPSAAIEPGQSIILVAEVVAERSLRTRTTVTAEPVNQEGEAVSGRPAANTVTILIDAVDPGGVPTFSEGLEASWQLLVGLGQVLVLFAGALIPFFWVPLLLWFLWRIWRRRSVSTPSDPAKSTQAGAEEG